MSTTQQPRGHAMYDAHNRPHPSGLNRHSRRSQEFRARAKATRMRRWLYESRNAFDFLVDVAIDSASGLIYPRGERINDGPNLTPRDPGGPARRHAMKARRGQRGS